MNLYLLSQNENNNYDTYDAMVVAAKTEEEAKAIHPGGEQGWKTRTYSSWASVPDNVTAELIGTATEGTEAGIILSSFNAG